ncbi:hypothetical protein [Halomonas sp. PGE1]|uniref:hypothetical protein n=1 Tax=Halomonas sp. PGE1 TaxID=2730360 RepID=UPI001476352B|nr:hypothetical protein [Halomonas sp. PGE1]QJQ99858.1 hypothetical protein HIR79_15190 [Halomonas sp. PGE1]
MTAAFEGTLDICERHAERLRWAMSTLGDKFPLSPPDLGGLSDIDLAVVDQFIMRFSKLQDAMGAKLLPDVLELTKEPGEFPAFIDKVNRLEKIGAIPSAFQWLQLREMRNQFSHEYPDDPDIQASLLNKAFRLASALLDTLEHIKAFSAPYLADARRR